MSEVAPNVELDERLVLFFRSEVSMQCRFVIIAAAELEDLLNHRPAREQARRDQARADAEAYRGENPDDVEGFFERLEQNPRESPAISNARIWLALQNILVSAANISKLLWGSGGRRAAERAPLRQIVQVDDSSPLRDPALRNDFEHIDERIIDWKEEGHPIVGRNIWHDPPGVQMVGNETPGNRFGHFDPVTGIVSFWAHEVDVRAIIAEATRIYPLAD